MPLNWQADAAAGSFRSSIETLTGDADLEVTAIGGIPDEVVGKLATLPYSITVRPRIEDYAVVKATGQTVPLIGLDLIAERPENLNLDRQNSAKADDLADTAEPRRLDQRRIWEREPATRFGYRSTTRLTNTWCAEF